MKPNQKRLIRLIVAFLVVSVLLILKNESAGWRTRFFPQKSVQPFPSLKKEQIKELVFTKNKSIAVYKKEKNWYVKIDNNEFLADAERISKIINSIISLKKDNIVSKNKNKHKELGIDKANIELKTDEKTSTVYLGNVSGLSSNSTK